MESAWATAAFLFRINFLPFALSSLSVSWRRALVLHSCGSKTSASRGHVAFVYTICFYRNYIAVASAQSMDMHFQVTVLRARAILYCFRLASALCVCALRFSVRCSGASALVAFMRQAGCFSP
eukprot:IDg12762t1